MTIDDKRRRAVRRSFVKAMVVGNWPRAVGVSIDVAPVPPELVVVDVEGAELGRIEMWSLDATEVELRQTLAEVLAAELGDCTGALPVHDRPSVTVHPTRCGADGPLASSASGITCGVCLQLREQSKAYGCCLNCGASHNHRHARWCGVAVDGPR